MNNDRLYLWNFQDYILIVLNTFKSQFIFQLNSARVLIQREEKVDAFNTMFFQNFIMI